MIDGEPRAARLGRDLGDPAQGRHDHRHVAHEPVQDRGRRRGRQADVRADRRAVAIGGEDTLGVASRLFAEHDLPVVGVPKTIDNDLNGTDYTFGFDTAVYVATEAIDRCHSTAESHNRIIVVETMGRHAGWIALMSGIAGGADYILIPEQPVVYDDVAAAVERRRARGKNFSVIVASEGCELPGVARRGRGRRLRPRPRREPRRRRDGRAGDRERAPACRRARPCSATSSAAARPPRATACSASASASRPPTSSQAGNWGQMAALHGDDVVSVPLTEATAELKLVPQSWYDTAKTFFG